MEFKIKVPQLSESTSNATLLKWHKNIGDLIKKNDHLIDIETDKIVLEILSPHKGKLIKILKKNGENVISNESIAILKINENNINNKKINNNLNNEKINNNLNNEKINNNLNNKEINNNLNNKKINNNLNNKKINKKDINNKNKINKNFNIKNNNIININKNKSKKIVKMNSLRINLAKNLIKSQKNNATLTTFNEINMKSIIDLRNKYKDIFYKKYNLKLSFMSFFIKATILSLKKFPIINSSINNDNIIYYNYYDINIAINSKRGLITPVLKNVENMSFFEIEYKISELVEKSKNNKLSINDLNIGTFTISNGGVFGSMLSTPIINYPQSAILGIHSIKDRVIIENNKILIRPISYFALSYDHRIIDGKDAILFLISIKKILENPLSLLLDI